MVTLRLQKICNPTLRSLSCALLMSLQRSLICTTVIEYLVLTPYSYFVTGEYVTTLYTSQCSWVSKLPKTRKTITTFCSFGEYWFIVWSRAGLDFSTFCLIYCVRFSVPAWSPGIAVATSAGQVLVLVRFRSVGRDVLILLGLTWF